MVKYSKLILNIDYLTDILENFYSKTISVLGDQFFGTLIAEHSFADKKYSNHDCYVELQWNYLGHLHKSVAYEGRD